MASVKRDGDRVIIFDSSILSECTKEMFDPSWWEKRGDILGHSSGRGKAWFVRGERFPMVLRRYRRGGMMARVLGDRFLGVFPESSRAFLEYALLERMISLGLPVPMPVAAIAEKKGLFIRCSMLEERIEDSRSVAEIIAERALSAEETDAIGMTIRRFMDAGVYHSDLNIRNILLRGTEVFIIDFDKCALRRGDGWKKSVWDRLQRSFRKEKTLSPQVFYQDSDFDAIRKASGI